MYYVIARLSVHPEMSVDDVITEYCSAFGKAAPQIKRYLQYWEQYTENVAYPSPNVGAQKEGMPQGIKGWENFYSDKVLDGGYAILDQATKVAVGDDGLVKQRIQFLREGLDIVKATRNVLQLGNTKLRTTDQEKEYQTLAQKLFDLRREYTSSNVVWGEADYYIENHFHIPTITDSLTLQAGEEKLMNLNADWRFKTDPDKSGLQQDFSLPSFNDKSWGIISATDNWQNQGFPDYHGTAWYRKTIEIPKAELGQQLWLSFGAVDGSAVIYINGLKAGEHLLGAGGDGWSEAFDIDITNFVKSGENTIAIQVTKMNYKSGIYKGVVLLGKTVK
jgi:hypothetical protein